MSTRHDKNYKSYENLKSEILLDVTLDPLADGWLIDSWQDTAKFYRCEDCMFSGFYVPVAGTEDGLDVGTECDWNHFQDWTVAGGKYVLTLKSGSDWNFFKNFLITEPGKAVDIEIGNWSSTTTKPSTGNRFVYWRRMDGEPVTYAYRWGCRPKFFATKTRHLWWRSIGITVYWAGKYFWHKILGKADK